MFGNTQTNRKANPAPKEHDAPAPAKEAAAPQKPSHGLYAVAEGGEHGYWTRIGAAWPHRDGKGFSLDLELLPVKGDQRLVLRAMEERREAQS